MYNHRIISAMVFITLFICIELSFATVAWRLFGYTLWTRISQWADSLAKENAGYTETSSGNESPVAGIGSGSEKSDEADDNDNP
jgi:hypothetical protein